VSEREAPEPEQPAHQDGRRARSARTRSAIARALFELIEAGHAAPTAQQIADRAGVALRSIRQHFETREELFLAAAALYGPRLERVREPGDPSAPLAERIASLVRRRADELEQTAALRRAVQRLAAPSPSVDEAARRVAAERRAELLRLFAPELAARDRAGRKRVLDRLDALSGGRLWDALRLDLGLSSGAAREHLRELLTGCLERALGQ
jgi:AcrR family transcriptional regulator